MPLSAMMMKSHGFPRVTQGYVATSTLMFKLLLSNINKENFGGFNITLNMMLSKWLNLFSLVKKS